MRTPLFPKGSFFFREDPLYYCNGKGRIHRKKKVKKHDKSIDIKWKIIRYFCMYELGIMWITLYTNVNTQLRISL